MMDNANVRWPASLWVAATPPGTDLPRLVGTAEADVIVIGGGFTGLSTALHLREAGVDVAVVEAMEPGPILTASFTSRAMTRDIVS
jgi:glycerol-3-phosphate dehydrogenase